MSGGFNEEPEDDHGADPAGGAGGGGNFPAPPTGGAVTAAATAQAKALPLIVPIVALLIYVGFVVYMLKQSTASTDPADQIRWSRLVFIFSGIEGIAFAAAGFLFGREVNRARAENAETWAHTEKKRADNASKQRDQAKAKAKELSEGIRDLADLTEEAREAVSGGSGVGPPGAGMAPPGAVPPPPVKTNTDAMPVILNAITRKVRRLEERSRSLD